MGSNEDTSGPIPRLPSGLRLTYLAEGAANIIYKIEAEDTLSSDEILTSEIESYSGSTPPPTELEDGDMFVPGNEILLRGKLLRLRKDRMDSVSPLESQRDFERLIRPLFDDEELIQSTAIGINGQLISQLNAEMKTMEDLGTRAALRCGIYLKSEAHGTVMNDVVYGLQSTVRILELKPKWLLQSSDAPKGSRRCRTCALREMRAANPTSGVEAQKDTNNAASTKTTPTPSSGNISRISGFCPLDLSSQSKPHITQTLTPYFQTAHLPVSDSNLLLTFLQTSPLLQKLKNLQASLQTSSSTADLLLLMTLRDCSLFLTLSPIGVTSARLGDLDLKSSTRIGNWRDNERGLCEGGWYESLIEGGRGVRCALERQLV